MGGGGHCVATSEDVGEKTDRWTDAAPPQRAVLQDYGEHRTVNTTDNGEGEGVPNSETIQTKRGQRESLAEQTTWFLWF